MKMKDYKKWLTGLRTYELRFEKESMEWVKHNGSTDKVKTIGAEKLQCVIEEIQRREGFSGIS
jgi:hypothetical protein